VPEAEAGPVVKVDGAVLAAMAVPEAGAATGVQVVNLVRAARAGAPARQGSRVNQASRDNPANPGDLAPKTSSSQSPACARGRKDAIHPAPL
jgi:hypothetical protein